MSQHNFFQTSLQTEQCNLMAAMGDLEGVKTIQGWNETTCGEAAKWGRMEILKFLKSQGCPWDSTTCSNAALSHLFKCRMGRSFGYFEIPEISGMSMGFHHHNSGRNWGVFARVQMGA
jgi:hypothetical protein